MTRHRADVVLADRGLFPSREQAKAAIIAGQVRLNGQVVQKAGQDVDPEGEFEIERGPQYVSRGGHKLDGALEGFRIDVTGLRAIDVGASTGGFTDRLLQGGAESVVAVDVGYGQLAWRLRNDERVKVFERTNIRSAEPEALGAPFDLAVIDVSFIGLAKVLPRVLSMLTDEGQLVGLVKPQFEAGKGRVGKKGVVRDPQIHTEVLEAIRDTLVDSGLVVRGLTWSPIKGPEGNIEFWVWASFTGQSVIETPGRIVELAHESLGD
ncbi:MAG: TlyA family RNA methyltransferase [Actinomycetota bacterium]|jgi:23S rRNA (cytidine1920-2'-O)/16S rRNA (cytidine1409-2'-O)-methyltransferase|nr:TlyA family RNA methyltransferase [Actinomycetota bacterium]